MCWVLFLTFIPMNWGSFRFKKCHKIIWKHFLLVSVINHIVYFFRDLFFSVDAPATISSSSYFTSSIKPVSSLAPVYLLYSSDALAFVLSTCSVYFHLYNSFWEGSLASFYSLIFLMLDNKWAPWTNYQNNNNLEGHILKITCEFTQKILFWHFVSLEKPIPIFQWIWNLQSCQCSFFCLTLHLTIYFFCCFYFSYVEFSMGGGGYTFCSDRVFFWCLLKVVSVYS